MWLFNKKKEIDYGVLISTLEKGDDGGIQDLLWQPRKGHIRYLPVVTKMFQRFKKTNNSPDALSVLKKIEKGNYQLIIFGIPWDSSDVPFAPLVIDKTTAKVVGGMLPFNELHNHISRKCNSLIGDLGVQWVMFTFEIRAMNAKA